MTTNTAHLQKQLHDLDESHTATVGIEQTMYRTYTTRTRGQYDYQAKQDYAVYVALRQNAVKMYKSGVALAQAQYEKRMADKEKDYNDNRSLIKTRLENSIAAPQKETEVQRAVPLKVAEERAWPELGSKQLSEQEQGRANKPHKTKAEDKSGVVDTVHNDFTSLKENAIYQNVHIVDDPTGGNGNCQIIAVLKWVAEMSKQTSIHYDGKVQVLSVANMRRMISHYLLTHSHFKGFDEKGQPDNTPRSYHLCETDGYYHNPTIDSKTGLEAGYVQYLEDFLCDTPNKSLWGSHTTLIAMAHILKRDIKYISSNRNNGHEWQFLQDRVLKQVYPPVQIALLGESHWMTAFPNDSHLSPGGSQR
ncbi:hypothetical protein T484DRAFT_1755126 [Baffinella frigidus]|nr:hypothetical protein T484DRAFT_1755126 [Cryptophyta sp. CCMP2293]